MLRKISRIILSILFILLIIALSPLLILLLILGLIIPGLNIGSWLIMLAMAVLGIGAGSSGAFKDEIEDGE
ncbi:MAG: hypothetical protein KDD19_11460 [Phaeodactylibacter sp.]|nr:hypothetical protein [Phaeodactylibacter sp.]MCB9049264.1 hypothetical protein [Lewinellaceae bacterium]